MRFKHRQSTPNAGFTLIEVAIALAIFVIGALAIIRIFPGALSVVQTSGERATAMNLARGRSSAYDSNPLSVPRAIYDAVPGGWQLGTPGATVGSANRNQALPKGDAAGSPALANFDFSALGHFKTITGERHTVSNGQIGVLAEYPIDGDVKVFQEGSIRNVRLVYDSTGTPPLQFDFSNATVTYDGKATPATSNFDIANYLYSDGSTVGDTTLYVTYTYSKSGAIWTAEDEPVVFATATSTPELIQVARDGTSVPSQTVNLRFRKLVDIDSANTTDEGDLGFYQFNTYSPTTDGTIVSLDYTTKDWRWLVDDSAPVAQPLPGDNTKLEFVRNLPIRNLDQADINNGSNQTVLISAFYRDLSTTPTVELLQANQTSASNLTNLDAKVAQVTYEASKSATPRPTRSRIVYATRDNWTLQPSVAVDTYQLMENTYTTATTVQEPWRFCVLKDDTLYFPPSEAGKTVSVTYTYNDGTNHLVEDRIFVIDKDINNSLSGLPADFTTLYPSASTVQLTSLDGLIAVTPISIRSIRGLSIQVRAAWLSGDTFSQASVQSYRRPN